MFVLARPPRYINREYRRREVQEIPGKCLAYPGLALGKSLSNRYLKIVDIE